MPLNKGFFEVSFKRYSIYILYMYIKDYRYKLASKGQPQAKQMLIEIADFWS